MRLRVLMEEQQRVEIGQRIRELREASPQTNESIADYTGVGVRAVANWISGATGIRYDHAKKVAELFEVDVRWLWDGKERPEAGDLFGAFSETQDSPALAAVRALEKRLDGRLEAIRVELLAELAQIRSVQEDQRKRSSSSGRKREGDEK